MHECDEIRKRTRIRVMLVTINKNEEEMSFMTSKEDSDGVYIQRESGVVLLYTTDGSKNTNEQRHLQPTEPIKYLPTKPLTSELSMDIGPAIAKPGAGHKSVLCNQNIYKTTRWKTAKPKGTLHGQYTKGNKT